MVSCNADNVCVSSERGIIFECHYKKYLHVCLTVIFGVLDIEWHFEHLTYLGEKKKESYFTGAYILESLTDWLSPKDFVFDKKCKICPWFEQKHEKNPMKEERLPKIGTMFGVRMYEDTHYKFFDQNNQHTIQTIFMLKFWVFFPFFPKRATTSFRHYTVTVTFCTDEFEFTVFIQSF